MSTMFQHRHYAKIAQIIASMDDDIRELVATIFTRELKGTNPNFDAMRFIAAARGAPENGRDKHTDRHV